MLSTNQIRKIRVESAQYSFWRFCKTVAPAFYLDSRPHLKTICTTLQQLYEGNLLKPDGTPYKKLMLNIPPQHGKSRTLVNFSDWIFGKDPNEKIITCSYNDSVASDFSKYTRDGIMQTKNNENEIVYSDIFPNTKIKRGTSSFEKWALEGQHFSYLGAGVGGSVTGKGATILIVDDPVKSAEDALNENNLNRIWLWYTSTFLSRVSADKGEPMEIICMTRWSKNDICGKTLDSEDAVNWYQLKMEATDKQHPGEMLCEDLFSLKRYYDQRSKVHEGIFNANYHQEAIELAGVLFKRTELKRFSAKDLTNDGLECTYGYCDVKDEGDDCLSFPFGKVYKDKIFITDVIYSSETVDVTVPQSIAMIKKLNCEYVRVEKNNQGGGFIRDLRREISPDKVLPVHNSTNKLTRIWNEYNFIMTNCYFLNEDEIIKGSEYDKFITNLCGYMKDGSSKHDDAADSMAGLSNMIKNFLKHLFNGL